MSEEREEVYQILELGKHLKNLHHKKGFGGLLFIDLSMIKFSKLSSYIRQLDKENQELKLELSGYRQAILEDKDMLGLKEESEELKKQLEENKDKINWYENCEVNKTRDKLRLKHNTQQKEFIDYMNKTIEECNNYSKYIEKKTKELHGRSCGKTYIANEIMKNEVAKKILEEILSKYKEIIGDINDKK